MVLKFPREEKEIYDALMKMPLIADSYKLDNELTEKMVNLISKHFKSKEVYYFSNEGQYTVGKNNVWEVVSKSEVNNSNINNEVVNNLEKALQDTAKIFAKTKRNNPVEVPPMIKSKL
jgi:hypothetical protein